MISKDEALKMAIDAMETADAIVWEYSGVPYEKLQEALKICKEALKPHADCDETCMYQCEMETKPHQWQGLTYDEMEYACSKCDKDFSISAFKMGVIWAEQALKDKNT